MHDLLVMHFFETLEDAVDNCSDFIWFEFVLGLYLVVQLTSLQQFNNNIEGVLRLEHFEKTHAIFVL